LDPEIAHLVVGLEPVDLQDRPVRATSLGRPVHVDDPPPMRFSRLRGSMYSFSETASRKSPMNVIVTNSVGKTNHHQTPETMALCWLAQKIIVPTVGVSRSVKPRTDSVTSRPIDQLMLLS